MRTTATLIRKEPLKTNFKLTFTKHGEKEFFLILHQDEKEIYQQLIIKCEYSFSWRRGKNQKYTFINKNLIESKAEERNEVKELFFKNLGEELKLENLEIETIEEKLREIKKENNNPQFLRQAKRLIQLLFLKKRRRGETEKQEKVLLTDLELLFLVDWSEKQN